MVTVAVVHGPHTLNDVQTLGTTSRPQGCLNSREIARIKSSEAEMETRIDLYAIVQEFVTEADT